MNKNNDFKKRISKHLNLFEKYYKKAPDLIVSSPGRAEILGNHTDYNNGFALACAISESVVAGFSKRDDLNIRIRTTAFQGEEVIFTLKSLTKNGTTSWVNYAIAVIKELIAGGRKIKGADIFIDSSVPKSGGVSGSAAFELAIARGMLALNNQKLDPLQIALLCKNAENSEIVNSPCGFLDQGSVALSKKGHFVLFDFLPAPPMPISKYELIPAKKALVGYTFIITVDRKIERQLGQSGYRNRRESCEKSLPFFEKNLNRKIRSLRDVSPEEFESLRETLQSQNPVMRKRVEHVIYENKRVLDSVKALKNNDIQQFGKLLNQSGESALELYDLDENTPQLTFLVKESKKIPGVVGSRNMGGGFSAIILSLIEKKRLGSFKKSLSRIYKTRFKNDLTFIEFEPENGTEITYKRIS